MLKKVLIANRSEIAVRVINACRELGIKTVAIYSEPDSKSRHVELADEAHQLEGSPAKVYLDGDQIIGIARKCGADAVHPGYGFLSENAGFARALAQAGIKFIGPEPDVIHSMGSKVESRRVMEGAGVPVVPGTTDPVTDVETVKALGTKYGYPIAIKASAGGGGRGMKVVRTEAEAEAAFQAAQREGSSYFGNAEVYVEKYLDQPRHVEVQIMGDEHGNVIHLGERDCSSQRRHQKLLEESPAFNLNPDVRKKLLEAAVKGAKALNYTSAGTVEMLVSGNDFYFLEVNTRVQVEHPVTEMVYGVDIVKEQLMIAAGRKLSVKQEEVKPHGHAIECRINAEDPYKNFMPNPGTVKEYAEPRIPWVRVDSACYRGYQILPFYDSLLAKLIVWGRDREEAIARTRVALKEYKIEGVSTTIPFHLALLDDARFREGRGYTTYIESEMMKEFVKSQPPRPPQTAAPVVVKTEKNGGVSVEVTATTTNGKSGHSVERVGPYNFEVEVNQKVFKVAVTELVDESKGKGKSRPPSSSKSTTGGARAAVAGGGTVRAPMHGLVKEIFVKVGDSVEAGQKLLIFEAMKMESEVVAPLKGKVKSMNAKVGETLESGNVILEID